MKTIYIIPGRKQSFVVNKEFKEIAKHFEKKWYKVVEVTIDRNYNTMSDYVQQFITDYWQWSHGTETTILWFSFWAMIAYIACEKVRADNLILCSMSPYFSEFYNDIPKKRWKIIWERRKVDFNKISLKKIIKKLHANIILFYGDAEHILVEKTVELLEKNTTNANVYCIKWAAHDISNKKYLQAIFDRS